MERFLWSKVLDMTPRELWKIAPFSDNSLDEISWALVEAQMEIRRRCDDDSDEEYNALEDDDYNIVLPIKAIKHLMAKEIESHYSTACQSLHNGVQRGFLHLANREIQKRIERAQDKSELEEILSDMDYRMSLQEWVNSL